MRTQDDIQNRLLMTHTCRGNVIELHPQAHILDPALLAEIT